MFDFLKNKLKKAVNVFSKELKEENKVEETPEIKEEKKELEEIKEKPVEIKKEIKEETKEKGFLQKIKEKITTKKIDDKHFEKLFSDLELILLENNVAVEVIDKIKQDLKIDLVDVGIQGKVEDAIKNSLKKSLESVLREPKFDLIQKIKEKREKPYTIVFVGVNGSGKTTTIAKLANLLLKNRLKVVLVAADTWRSAAIEQLEEHGKKLGIKVIKHSYGSDPTAVVWDGISYGKAHNIDVVLVDTAGRQHSNKNLMQEMEKIVRVIKPDLKIFVGETLIGNDAVEQGQNFNKTIGIDGVILTKSDVDEKGGAIISISYVTLKPIIYLGKGQNYDDLEKFNKDIIINNLGF